VCCQRVESEAPVCEIKIFPAISQKNEFTKKELRNVQCRRHYDSWPKTTSIYIQCTYSCLGNYKPEILCQSGRILICIFVVRYCKICECNSLNGLLPMWAWLAAGQKKSTVPSCHAHPGTIASCGQADAHYWHSFASLIFTMSRLRPLQLP